MTTYAVPVIPSHIVATPSLDYYVRKYGELIPLLAKVSWAQAHASARKHSEDNSLGCTEVYTFFGTRAGDPPVEPRYIIISIYQRGRLVMGGKLANMHSQDNLPLTSISRLGF
jgi:hypothetical protein